MANHTSGSERRNKRMFEIFERSNAAGHKGMTGDSKTPGVGVHSPAMEEARKSFAKKQTMAKKTK